MKKFLNLLSTIFRWLGIILERTWFILSIICFVCLYRSWAVAEESPTDSNNYMLAFCSLFPLYIISGILLLVRRKFIQFVFAAIAYVILFLFMLFVCFALQSAPTDFAKLHPIPEGMEYHTPRPENSELAAEVNQSDTTSYLQIRDGLQGGIYEYSFFYPQLPEGTIYLRCFEATKNEPLSESRIQVRSRQEISATTQFSCLVENKEFAIYEGDWGDCYAARVEVWFKDKQGNERKLLEKIYGVQGWMR